MKAKGWTLLVGLSLALAAWGVGCVLDGGKGAADEDGVAQDDGTVGNQVGHWASGGTWTAVYGPCPGSETNALWFDSRLDGWVGCGANAEGRGLFKTSDGGLTWEAQPAFDEVRVLDVRRGPDGVLYGAGFHTIEGYSAWRIDETGEPKPVGLFVPGINAFAKVAMAENIAVADDGQMMADSATGVSFAYKPSDGDFSEYGCLGEEFLSNPDAIAFQVRRIVSFDNRFWATGSIMSEPATVYLPSKLADATYHMQPMALQPETNDGELLDIHIWSATRMIAVGSDQSYNYPLIYVLDGDPYLRDNWKQVSLADFGIEYKAGMYSISVSESIVAGVGSRAPTSAGGFVVISEDGGETWADITPSDGNGSNPGVLSRVWLFGNGDILAAGAEHQMWIYQSP